MTERPRSHRVDALTGWIDSIHEGDCLELMRQLPDESVDLVVTSPPYNLLTSTGGGMRSTRRLSDTRWHNTPLSYGYDGYGDAMPESDYIEWQRECLTEMMRLLSPAGAIFYNHKWRVQNGLLQDRADIVDGFPVRQIIIWHRSGGFNHNRGYFLPTYEVIYLIAKDRFRLRDRATAFGDVWRIPQELNNSHPAAFPVELPRRAIASTSAQVVLDAFLGSGTTALAAVLEGRHYIGFEKSARYCEMARERVASARPAQMFP